MACWVGALGVVVGLSGCPEPPSAMCATVAECRAGERCVDGRCTSVRREDGGTDAGVDAAPESDANVEGDGGADGGADGGVDSGFDAGVDGGPPPGRCGLEPCAIYRLGPGASMWGAWPVGEGTFAPSTAVRAAFDLEAQGLAYVLTDDTYHVLRLADRVWIAEGPRNTLFPQAAGVLIRAAYSVPSNHAGGDGTQETITLLSSSLAYAYSMRTADRSVEFLFSRMYGDAWRASNAPLPRLIRFAWLDIENSRGWANADPSAICEAGGATVGPYQAVGTSTDVHLLEAGWCFEFYRRTPTATFAPFATSGAPDHRTIGAAFWNQGSLWLVAE